MNRYLLLAVCHFIAYTLTAQSPVIKHPGSASICDGKSLILSVEDAPTGASFKWRKDAVLIVPAATEASYTATTTGSYDVIVTKANVHDTLKAIKVTVNPNPVASFTASASGLCSNLPMQFTNTSTGSALEYLWSFDDPKSGTKNTSDARNPSHTFIGTPGNGIDNFKVVLVVTDSRGCKDNTNVTVNVKQIPGTQLDGTGYTLYNGLPYFTICNESNSTFEFINISSTKATNTNYQIKWGDASPDFNSATFNTPLTHDYSVGKHTLQFIVTGANGCKETMVYNVFVGSNPAVGLGNPGNTIICSGTSLTFPISNTSSNPPGTVYTVGFNDGSPSIVYNHPAPDDVTHRFDEGSCGIFSQGFSNSFSATIVASNPCATSAAAVVPIYVSKKGVANFSISPKDTACVNTTVTFTNIGTNASIISSQGQCTPGKSVWHITPATGWTTTGNMGSDLASNPANWQAGDNSLNVVFNIPGIYKIKLRTGGNLSCGGDELERTVCINPTPVANFTTNQATGCAPLTVTTTNTSIQPNCGINTYSWSVLYSSNTGCEPGESDFDFINGTNANSINPQFRFNNPGVYTIRLFTTSKSSNCTSVAFTRDITVKAKPTVSFNLPSSICQNSSINPTALVNNCYSTTAATYAWTFAGGIPATSTAAQPGPVAFNAAGTHTITLAVTNECGTTTITKQLTVKPTPDVTIPPNLV
ncbi:MAG: PKD domain-containing protein, partial [Sphingobacteriales bacterium]